MDVRKKVKQLIRKYKTDDPFKLADHLGIHVIYGDLGGKLGNYLKYKRSKFIIIDDKRTPENMLLFVCSQVGHALCTPGQHSMAKDLYHECKH